MTTKIVRLVSIAALLGAMVWRPTAGYRFLLQLAVFSAAILVAGQYYRMDRVRWSFAFAAIAALFNPVSSPEFSRGAFLALDAICISMFAASFYFPRSQPRLFMESAADR